MENENDKGEKTGMQMQWLRVGEVDRDQVCLHATKLHERTREF